MGYAKLNIWFRDQNGRAVFCENPVPDWNWIRIWDLGRYHPGEDHTPADHPGVGWRFQKVLSKPFENVEMKIPALSIRTSFMSGNLNGTNIW